MKNFVLLALVVLFSAPFVATGQDDNSTDVECSSITDILCTPGAGLKAICEAIEISELNDDLAEDSWTIFAPTDEAFMALGRENLDSLVFGNDTVPLTDLLLFHVFPGVGLTSDLLPCEAGNNLLEMANGKDSRTLCTKGVTPIEQRGQYNDKQDAPKFMETDILACNGVIHVLDKVMLYQPLPFDIPEATPKTEETAVTEAPTTADTSVITLDRLDLLISTPTPAPTSVSTSLDPTTAPTLDPTADTLPLEETIDGNETLVDDFAEEDCYSIAELACLDPDFSIACTLLQSTGVDEELMGGTWTVFAPMNDAFEAAPPFPEGTDIGFVLRGHMVPGVAIPFEDLVCTERIEMANGEDTRTVCRDDTTYQKGKGNSDDIRPEIISFNNLACNGIIHVVDQVILP